MRCVSVWCRCCSAREFRTSRSWTGATYFSTTPWSFRDAALFICVTPCDGRARPADAGPLTLPGERTPQSGNRACSRRRECVQETLVRCVFAKAGGLEPDRVRTLSQVLVQVLADSVDQIAVWVFELGLNQCLDLVGGLLATQTLKILVVVDQQSYLDVGRVGLVGCFLEPCALVVAGDQL